MTDSTLIKQTITSYLDSQEKSGKSPDMMTIMLHVSNKVSCTSLEVIRDVKALQRTLKVVKVRIGLACTYRLTRYL